MTLRKISFLIRISESPQEKNSDALAHLLEEARASMEEDGAATSLVRWGDPLPAPDRSELWISDFREGLDFLKENGRFFAAWRHPFNKDEDLSPAAYTLENLPQIDMDDFVKVWEREAGLPWTILKTDRLLLREFADTEDDLDALYRIYNDPDALRFLTPPAADRDEERAALSLYLERVYRFYGFGSWAVLLRDTGEIIGRAGFGLPDPEDASFTPSLGYLIGAGFRGRGYASEICRAIVNYGFRVLGFDFVKASADKDNTPSVRLLMSLGFRQSGSLTGEDGRKTLRFLLENPDRTKSSG